MIDFRASTAHQNLPFFLEDSHLNWGIRLKLDKICSDTDYSIDLSQHSNIIINRNGEVYHQSFVPEDACYETLIENYSSLLDS
jgi:hypothetical protein